MRLLSIHEFAPAPPEFFYLIHASISTFSTPSAYSAPSACLVVVCEDRQRRPVPLPALVCTLASMITLTVPLLSTGWLRNLGTERAKAGLRLRSRLLRPRAIS